MVKRTKGFVWCDAYLFYSPVAFALSTDEQAFKKELKRLNCTQHSPWLLDNEQGKVHSFSTQEGSMALIVAVRPSSDKDDLLLTLVHESVHVFQIIKEAIGEDKPSREFEAYSIESVFSALWQAYKSQTRTPNADTKRKQRKSS